MGSRKLKALTSLDKGGIFFSSSSSFSSFFFFSFLSFLLCLLGWPISHGFVYFRSLGWFNGVSSEWLSGSSNEVQSLSLEQLLHVMVLNGQLSSSLFEIFNLKYPGPQLRPATVTLCCQQLFMWVLSPDSHGSSFHELLYRAIPSSLWVCLN